MGAFQAYPCGHRAALAALCWISLASAQTHRSSSSAVGPSTAIVRWNAFLDASGAVSGPYGLGSLGLLVAGTPNSLFALNLTDSTQVWKQTMGIATAESFPMAMVPTGGGGSDPRVFVATATELLSLNATTGAIAWRRPYPFGADAPHAVAVSPDGTAVVLSYVDAAVGTATTVVSVPALTGGTALPLWQVDLPNTATDNKSCSGLTIHNDTVYIGTCFTAPTAVNKVYALLLSSGGIRWSYATTAPVRAAPSLNDAGDTVFFGDSSGQFHAVETASGTVRWVARVSNAAIVAQAAVSAAGAGASAGAVFVGATDGALTALQASSGAQLWRFMACGPLHTAPVLAANDVLYVAASTCNTLYVLQAASGRLLWTLPLQGQALRLASTPLLLPGTNASDVLSTQLYIGSSGGMVLSLQACGAGFFCPDGWPFPFLCPAGTASPGDQKQCAMCAPGTQQPSVGQAACVPCEPGSYTDRPGQVACAAAPAGSFINKTGAASAAEALLCPVNTANPLRGQATEDACVRCASGSVARTPGAARCVPDTFSCPPNTQPALPAPPAAASDCRPLVCTNGLVPYNVTDGSAAAAVLQPYTVCAGCAPGTWGTPGAPGGCGQCGDGDICTGGVSRPLRPVSISYDCAALWDTTAETGLVLAFVSLPAEAQDYAFAAAWIVMLLLFAIMWTIDDLRERTCPQRDNSCCMPVPFREVVKRVDRFALDHFLEPGEVIVKRPTTVGGCCTVVGGITAFCMAAAILLQWRTKNDARSASLQLLSQSALSRSSDYPWQQLETSRTAAEAAAFGGSQFGDAWQCFRLCKDGVAGGGGTSTGRCSECRAALSPADAEDLAAYEERDAGKGTELSATLKGLQIRVLVQGDVRACAAPLEWSFTNVGGAGFKYTRSKVRNCFEGVYLHTFACDDCVFGSTSSLSMSWDHSCQSYSLAAVGVGGGTQNASVAILPSTDPGTAHAAISRIRWDVTPMLIVQNNEIVLERTRGYHVAHVYSDVTRKARVTDAGKTAVLLQPLAEAVSINISLPMQGFYAAAEITTRTSFAELIASLLGLDGCFTVCLLFFHAYHLVKAIGKNKRKARNLHMVSGKSQDGSSTAGGSGTPRSGAAWHTTRDVFGRPRFEAAPEPLQRVSNDPVIVRNPAFGAVVSVTASASSSNSPMAASLPDYAQALPASVLSRRNVMHGTDGYEDGQMASVDLHPYQGPC